MLPKSLRESMNQIKHVHRETPMDYQPFCIEGNQSLIVYHQREVEFAYRTEPPHGDAIYSWRLPLLALEFPYWVYGRNLLCFESRFLLAEAVRKNSWSPVTSMVFDLQEGKYADLTHWYPRVTVKGKEICLSNEWEGRNLVLKDVHSLDWVGVGECK